MNDGSALTTRSFTALTQALVALHLFDAMILPSNTEKARSLNHVQRNCQA